jgi:histidinol phosphatase-like PHP family hydrolase
VLTPGDDPRLAVYRSNLANALSDRFKVTGRQADLDQAITWHLEAIGATPADHVDRPKRLANLGAAHGVRFALTRRQADLDQAIARQLEAVDCTPDTTGMVLLHGSELNIAADGSVDWDADFLSGFDICVASMQSETAVPKQCICRPPQRGPRVRRAARPDQLPAVL